MQVQQTTLEYTIAGRIGKTMEPAIRPIGFDYRVGTALIGAFAAKEVFVAQMALFFRWARSMRTLRHLGQSWQKIIRLYRDSA